MLEAVTLDFTRAGYAAEWFVAPGAFNMPQEVMVTQQGDLLVLSVRNGTLSRISDDGTVTRFADNVWGYMGDVDDQGNIYLYWQPEGQVTRISPGGIATTIVRSPELQAPCDSGFGIGPDGNLYLAHNQCRNTADLKRITPSGEITTVARSIPWMNALRTSPDGRLLGAGYDIYEISMADFSVSVLTRTPQRNLSAGGMAVDDEGNIYIADGNRATSGELYRISPNGAATLLAKIQKNGLSGIEWWPRTKEIVGGQLRQGGLVAVSSDGTQRELVPGNGIVTPMGMAFSPCGDLAVANDDGGMMTLVNPAGVVSWFFDYPSFQPPTPFVAFATDGTLFASVGAPGMPEEILSVPPDGIPGRLAKSAMPCGLAYRGDGRLFVAETSTGRIVQIQPDGSTMGFVEGLKFPQALVLDGDGNLYVVTGPAGFTGDKVFTTPSYGTTILRISPDGGVRTWASLQWVSALAMGPDGGLYAAAGSRVWRVTPDGTVSLFLSGLHHIRGLAFDIAGNLYAADEDLNGIVRIGGFPKGELTGVVRDSSGRPAAGAHVQFLSDLPVVVGQVVTTDAEGRFRLPVAPREYSVSVFSDDGRTATLEEVRVLADQSTTVEIDLPA
jgi:sugar lactone lactonase YvrE